MKLLRQAAKILKSGPGGLRLQIEAFETGEFNREVQLLRQAAKILKSGPGGLRLQIEAFE